MAPIQHIQVQTVKIQSIFAQRMALTKVTLPKTASGREKNSGLFSYGLPFFPFYINSNRILHMILTHMRAGHIFMTMIIYNCTDWWLKKIQAIFS